MDRPCNESIRKTLKLTERMLALADEGEAYHEDVGCGILYGILRDSAYKIKKLAEAERQAHIEKGWWKQQELGGRIMAIFKCTECGFEKEARCKPQKCPQCGEKKKFEKQQ